MTADTNSPGQTPQGGQPGDNMQPARTDNDPLHNEDVAHEHSDINVRAILLFLVGLTAVGVLSAAAMRGVFVVLEKQAAKNDPAQSPLAMPAAEMPKTTTQSPTFGNAQQGPKLLTNEPAALEEHRAHSRKTLETGEWVDQAAGIGRIPIAEAKKALLHKGLATRAGDPVDPRLGTRPGAMSDASSGRLATVKQTPTGGAQPQPAPQQPAAPPKTEHKPGGGH
jgi:hypothetical protein